MAILEKISSNKIVELVSQLMVSMDAHLAKEFIGSDGECTRFDDDRYAVCLTDADLVIDVVNDDTLGNYLVWDSKAHLDITMDVCDEIIKRRNLQEELDKLKSTEEQTYTAAHCGGSLNDLSDDDIKCAISYIMLYDRLNERGVKLDNWERDCFMKIKLLTVDADLLNSRINCDIVADLIYSNIYGFSNVEQAQRENSDIDDSLKRACEICGLSIGRINSNVPKWVVKDENGFVKGIDGDVKEYVSVTPLLVDNVEAPLKEAIIDMLRSDNETINSWLDDIVENNLPANYVLQLVENINIGRHMYINQSRDEIFVWRDEHRETLDKVAPLAAALNDIANHGNRISIDQHISFEYTPPRVKQLAVER